MMKNNATPASRRAVIAPGKPWPLKPERNAVWVTRTAIAATARRPSTGAKRGFPGGGATAGSAALTVLTAEHPPLHILFLALVDLLGGHGTLPQKFALCFVGTGTVGALGFLGRAVAGARVGLVAAAIGAVYPLLWVIDGSLMSETTYALLITLTLIVAYRYLRGPSVRWALALGAMIALATLTRGEAVGLLVLLALPLAW